MYVNKIVTDTYDNIRKGNRILTMDYIFLWCASLLSINRYLDDMNILETDEHITVLESTISHNRYLYSVMVGDKHLVYDFKFNSNTFAYGGLTITNQHTTESKEFVIVSNNNTIRLYTSRQDYEEYHIYNKSSIIAMSIKKNRKIFVTSVNVTNLTINEYDASVIRTKTTVPNKDDTDLQLTLFAVTGCIDYKNAHCLDTVCFKSSRMMMCIYSDINAQIICATKYPQLDIPGEISVMNSDFNHKYNYYQLEDNKYLIDEKVITRTGESVTKRKYSIKLVDNKILIPETNKTFLISSTKDALVFSKVLCEI